MTIKITFKFFSSHGLFTDSEKEIWLPKKKDVTDADQIVSYPFAVPTTMIKFPKWLPLNNEITVIGTVTVYH